MLTIAAMGCGSDGGMDATGAWNPETSPSGGEAGSEAAGSEDESSGPVTTAPVTSVGEESSGPVDPTADTSGSDGPSCEPATTPCTEGTACCSPFVCGSTSLGQVCCGNEGAPCATENGEDCCGALLCVEGTCGFEAANVCEPACTEAPALVIEKQRLANIGGNFLGICGDANHTYGYHVPAANLPADDYSLEGAANIPVCEWHAAAIDIGMDWEVSREWLAWLIEGIRNDDIQGIAEVIGSYDGVNVRYWSDSSGWHQEGSDYGGSGHDSWTHVSIYRSTALEDHGILLGWSANAGPP